MDQKKPSTAAWLELPEGIWANILHRLGPLEILLSAQKVCLTWRRICKDPSMWRVIDLWDVLWDASRRQQVSGVTYNVDEMLRHVIDCSQGELVAISLQFLATDELLGYVAERAEKLKRLTIAFCFGKVCKALDDVARKLPLLEELSVIHTTMTKQLFEFFLGHSCPKLKPEYFCYASDEEALAIAKNLPTLRHLQLIRNKMTNEGLKAILNGCPHLVSLDLRQCLYVTLNEDLTNRITQQIGDVKLPHDKSLDGLNFHFLRLEGAVDEHNMSDD